MPQEIYMNNYADQGSVIIPAKKRTQKRALVFMCAFLFLSDPC